MINFLTFLSCMSMALCFASIKQFLLFLLSLSLDVIRTKNIIHILRGSILYELFSLADVHFFHRWIFPIFIGTLFVLDINIISVVSAFNFNRKNTRLPLRAVIRESSYFGSLYWSYILTGYLILY